MHIHFHILPQISVYYCTELLFFFSSPIPLKRQLSAFLQNTFLSFIYFNFPLTSQNQNEMNFLQSKGSICASVWYQSNKNLQCIFRKYSQLSQCEARRANGPHKETTVSFSKNTFPFTNMMPKGHRYLLGLHPVPFTLVKKTLETWNYLVFFVTINKLSANGKNAQFVSVLHINRLAARVLFFFSILETPALLELNKMNGVLLVYTTLLWCENKAS